MDEMRVCPKCSIKKTKAEYGYRRVDGRTYVRAYCRACERNRSRERYKANPQRCREIAKQSAKRHPEKVRERYKKWWDKNREWRREYQVIRYWMNPDREREKRRMWISKVPLGYVNQLLGKGGKGKYPIEILEVKKMQVQINRLLKEQQ
jgi:hypothetical protein